MFSQVNNAIGCNMMSNKKRTAFFWYASATGSSASLSIGPFTQNAQCADIRRIKPSNGTLEWNLRSSKWNCWRFQFGIAIRRMVSAKKLAKETLSSGDSPELLNENLSLWTSHRSCIFGSTPVSLLHLSSISPVSSNCLAREFRLLRTEN